MEQLIKAAIPIATALFIFSAPIAEAKEFTEWTLEDNCKPSLHTNCLKSETKKYFTIDIDDTMFRYKNHDRGNKWCNKSKKLFENVECGTEL